MSRGKVEVAVSMKHWKTVLILSLVGLGFRALHYALFSNEVIVGPDQMREITLGRNFASGDWRGLLDTYWAPFYPLLIGCLSYFINSPVVPALLISIFCGSLAVPLTYYLTAQSYGAPVGIIAALIAVFYPLLINSVFAVGSENVYLALIVGALIIFWQALTRSSLKLYAITGVLLALSYLTRPEAIGYPFFFLGVALIYNLWQRRSVWRTWLPGAGMLALTFALISSPYILYLRSATGDWVVSGKAKTNTIIGDIGDEDEVEDTGPDAASGSTREFAKYFFLNLVTAHKDFPVLIPPLLFLLIGLGLWADAWDGERFAREAYLILFCLVTLAGYAAAVVQTRYFYLLLPIFFGWIALGIVRFSQWLYESIADPHRRKRLVIQPQTIVALCLFTIYLYAFPLNFFTRPLDKAWETRAYEERDAGLWLKEQAGPNLNVFSASMRPVFYSEGKPVPPKSTNIPDVVNDIKTRRVDYVVTSDRSLKRNPFLAGLDKVLENDTDFELVYDTVPRKGYRISVFKLK